MSFRVCLVMDFKHLFKCLTELCAGMMTLLWAYECIDTYNDCKDNAMK